MLHHELLQICDDSDLCLFSQDSPYDIIVDAAALIVMDVHSHLSMHEVMGLIGGFVANGSDGRTKVHVVCARPCKSAASSRHCEMDLGKMRSPLFYSVGFLLDHSFIPRLWQLPIQLDWIRILTASHQRNGNASPQQRLYRGLKILVGLSLHQPRHTRMEHEKIERVISHKKIKSQQAELPFAIYSFSEFGL